MGVARANVPCSVAVVPLRPPPLSIPSKWKAISSTGGTLTRVAASETALALPRAMLFQKSARALAGLLAVLNRAAARASAAVAITRALTGSLDVLNQAAARASAVGAIVTMIETQ